LAVTVPLYDSNKDFVERQVPVAATASTGVVSGTITTPANVYFMQMSCPSSGTTNI